MKTSLTIIFSIYLTLIFQVVAQELTSGSISCQTPNEEKIFNISYKENLKEINTNVKFPLTKISYEKGIKQKIFIADLYHFDEASDYLTLTSSKGHKITYSLKCQMLRNQNKLSSLSQ